MKDFFRYSKNRILYSLFKILIVFVIAFIISLIRVKADTIVNNMTTNYYYATYTNSSVPSTTGFRDYGTAMYGMEDYPPTYNTFEYLTGFDIYIPFSVRSGSIYTVTVSWSGSSLKSSEFLPSIFGERLSTLDNVHSVNGNITDVNTSYSTSSCFNYSGDSYCTYNFKTTYTFNATTTADAFRVGTYYTNGWGLYFTRHYLTSEQKINSIRISQNNDNTIINQNDTIINQNQDIINQNNTAENTRKGIWDTIKSFPSTFSNFFKDLGDKIGNFFDNLLKGILDGLKSLFIPEDGYFTNWLNDFKEFFEEKLGFLLTPFELFITFVNKYLSLDASSDIIINIPNISVPNFEDANIISATTFNWSATLNSKEALKTLWILYLDFIDVYLILNFLNLCENKYNRIFGGDTSNYEYYTVEDSYTFDNNTGEVLSSRRNERTTTRKKVE